MSAKQLVLRAVTRLPEWASREEVLNAVTVELTGGYDATPLSDAEWGAFVTRGFAAGWDDPREDIYSEADGVMYSIGR